MVGELGADIGQVVIKVAAEMGEGTQRRMVSYWKDLSLSLSGSCPMHAKWDDKPKQYNHYR